MSGDFTFFLPLAKVDAATRTVSGYASTPTLDMDGEIVSLDAIKKALPGYWEWRNIREMHQPKAIGVGKEANVDERGLFLTSKIVDDAAWKKVEEGVYKGYSIGGRKLAKNGETITEIELIEVSLVDRPANPDCRISIAKKAKGSKEAYLIKSVSHKRTASDRALEKVAKAVEILSKEGPPAAHDGFSLPAPGKEPSPLDAEPNQTRKADGACEAHGRVGCPDCLDKGGDAPGEGDKPYGNVEYADPGLQADGKKRYPIDTEEHIRAAWNYINKPKNAAKYGDKASQVKSKIVSAWKSKIDPAGPPSAQKLSKKAKKLAKKLAKMKAKALKRGVEKSLSLSPRSKPPAKPSFLTLEPEPAIKGLPKGREILSLDLQKGGPIRDMVSTNLEDEVFNMDGVTDGLDKALLDFVKRAAAPTRAQRMEMVRKNLKKAREARDDAEEAIRKAHAMCKAAYLSKAAKKDGKKNDNDADDFDHADMMGKLQKAHSALMTQKTFMKAAKEQLAKAAGRSGQRGQGVGDADPGFYQVPPGVKDLSPSDLATASPGGDGRGSEPPLYPADGGVYPGKSAKKGAGLIPAYVAEMMAKTAKLEGEVEALRRIPASAGSRRPYNFNPNAFMSGPSSGTDVNKALYAGVNMQDLVSDDEGTHTAATAKVIGNLLTSGQFGKPIMDPNFHGTAGIGKE